tara:strand:+ start:447 stop:1136 length:690 start_codon:yes stop_codon:yes gene_type:complete
MNLKKEREGLDILEDFLYPLIFTIFIYSGIRAFLFEARYIPSGSMLPILEIQDRLFIEKLTFKRRSPQRGDIVVFNSPYRFDKELIHLREKKIPSKFLCSIISFPIISSLNFFSDPTCDAYIKRIVAIEGDQVFVDSSGRVFINGNLIKESFNPNYCINSFTGKGFCKILNIEVPESNYVVLGDNRGNSWDSRYWPGGPFLPYNEIIGRASWRFWPLNRFGSISEQYHD